MKISRIRTGVALSLIALIFIGHITSFSIGTYSAIGWRELALLCPLGALGTMLASKSLVPQALLSLGAAIVLIILFGRVFCSWVCPVPLVSKIPNLFKTPASASKTSRSKAAAKQKALTQGVDDPDQLDKATEDEGKDAPLARKRTYLAAKPDSTSISVNAAKPDSASHEGSVPRLGVAPQSGCSSKKGCSACSEKRSAIDSRHFVLGASLLSAFIFGFPVFCAVCPIGLTIATILLIVQLFVVGETTWTLLLVPTLLAIEVIFFRKWCTKICPVSAFTSLISKLSFTFKPRIDDEKCIETSRNRKCGICARVCSEQINLRHPESSYAATNECTNCFKCVEACPTKALKKPFLARGSNNVRHTEKQKDNEEKTLL